MIGGGLRGQNSFSRKLPLSYLLAIIKIGIQVYVSSVEFKLFYSKKVSKASVYFEKFVLQFLGAMKIKLSPRKEFQLYFFNSFKGNCTAVRLSSLFTFLHNVY